MLQWIRRQITTLRQVVPKSADSFLVLLLVTDAALILLHILRGIFNWGNLDFSIAKERGYGEVFQYMKYFWIAAIFFYLTFRKRSLLYGAWVLLFLYLLIDDFGRVHEQLGAFLRRYMQTQFQTVFGMPGQAIRELVGSLFPFVIFFLLIGAAYCLTPANPPTPGPPPFREGLGVGRTSRQVSNHLIMLVFILAFFGVGMDMVHSSVKSNPALASFMGLFEDGGEMVAVSFIAWFAYGQLGGASSDG